MSLSDAVGPYDAAPTRVPAGYPSMDAPGGDNEYGAMAGRANANLLLKALADAGVDLFAFDQAVVTMLAGSSNPAVVRTVVGWIVRANLAGTSTGVTTATSTASTLNAQASGLLTGLLKTALGNQAAGATSAATAIADRVNALAATWTDR
jgi:hypothetical protein